MKKYLFISSLLLVLLVVSGCGNKPSPTSDNSTDNSNKDTATEATTTSNDIVPADNLVLVQDGKFGPPVITVKKGTEITWVNKDPDPCWIASDPHPTHTGYPNFDTKKGIKQGETYKFKFDKVGTFGYHDHLNISNTGKVEVTP